MISLKQSITVKTACCALAAGAVAVIPAFALWRHYWRKPCSLRKQDAVILVCKNVQEYLEIEEQFLQLVNETKVLGLDCEWVQDDEGKRHKVALLQLAPSDNFCLILRLTHLSSLPESITDILKNPLLLKVGVSIFDDAQKLCIDYNLQVSGCLDLRYILIRFSKLQYQLMGRCLGLKNLSDTFLGGNLDKSWSLRCTNWEAETLTEREIRYAADDALVGFQLAQVMIQKQHWTKMSFKEVYLVLYDIFSAFGDVSYKPKNYMLGTSAGNTRNSKQRPPKNKYRSYDIRKKPLYCNVILEAPDGEQLCTCDDKKALWYVAKNLGIKISDDPLRVRLKFEPNSRPVLDSSYYVAVKDNKCVVCGSTDMLIRKNVVPQEYRRYFPVVMKQHTSHDVVLLCAHCHQRSNCLDLAMRNQLAIQCQAPYADDGTRKYQEDSHAHKIRSAAKALRNGRNKIPLERRLVLETIVRNHYNIENDAELSDDLLLEATQLPTKLLDPSFESHGSKVCRFYADSIGLMHLESLWRQHFLDSMQPKHLPQGWSVDHNHEVLAVKIATGRAPETNPRIIGLDDAFIEKAVEKAKMERGESLGRGDRWRERSSRYRFDENGSLIIVEESQNNNNDDIDDEDDSDLHQDGEDSDLHQDSDDSDLHQDGHQSDLHQVGHQSDLHQGSDDRNLHQNGGDSDLHQDGHDSLFEKHTNSSKV